MIVIVLMLLPGEYSRVVRTILGLVAPSLPVRLEHGSNYTETAIDLVAGKVVHCLSPCI